jgi:hypothetical protein
MVPWGCARGDIATAHPGGDARYVARARERINGLSAGEDASLSEELELSMDLDGLVADRWCMSTA